MKQLALLLYLSLVSLAVAAAPPFSLDSRTLTAGGRMPRANVYTQCGGGNQSPELQWHDPPAGTRSFAVTMYDPDARFWHWIAFDIMIGAHGLNADAGTPHSGNAPGDTEQPANDFGNAGYSGPCPPPGNAHRYVITAYAIDVPKLGVVAHFSRAAALAAIKQHALAKATLTVSWGR